jgi:RNA polymerase sigma factor (sigma-70 family)
MGKMPDRTDIALLEAWSAGSSEEAFAALARRYGGLLYHAARRRTGRDDLAGEAAQNSLLILARKAPQLRHLPSLAGWLHRTACYEASKLLRRESRHQARMKHLPLPDDDDEGASWKDAAPLLDRALDELPEKDRQVIFLKYFEGLSFEQMARRFGGEPAAWRQRGSRAVERLRMSLTKRGAAVSATALATGLGTSFTQAAPTAFLATLPPASTAVAALSWKTLSLHSLHLMKMKPAVVFTIALLASLIPLGFQAAALSDARLRVSALEASSQPGSAADPSRHTSLAENRGTSLLSLVSLADGLLAVEQGDPIRGWQIERRIAAMDRDELERRLMESGDIDLGTERRRVLVRALFWRYCKLSPYSGTKPDRVLALATRLSAQMRADGGDLWGAAEEVIGQWVADDAENAAAWYRSAWQSGSLGETTRSALVAGEVFNGLQAKDPAAALGFYRSLSDTERQVVLGGGGAYTNPDLLFELSLDIKDARLRGISLDRAFGNSEGKSPAEIREWIQRVQAEGPEAADWIARAAKGSSAPTGTTPETIATRLEWLREAAEGLDAARATGVFLSDICRSDPGAAFKALDAEWERNPDVQMLATYVGRSYFDERTVTDAIRRSRLITDRELREEALRLLLRVPRPNGDARELARKGGLTEVELDRILPQQP